MHRAGSIIQGSFPGGIARVTALAQPPVRQMHPAVPQPPVSNGTAVRLPDHLTRFDAGPGQSLPAAVRQKMEAAFGQSFTDVRVHAGPYVSALGAVAFTQGSHIHFAPGRFDPNTQRGQEILAHELAHVVQQRAGRVSNPFGAGVAVVHDQRLEIEAQRMSTRAVVQRAWVPPHKRGGGGKAPEAKLMSLGADADALRAFLMKNGNWAIQRIVGYAGDYVTIQLEEPFLYQGQHYLVQFNIHRFNQHNPCMGSIWAAGIRGCAINAQDNPRHGTLLAAGLDFWRREQRRPPAPDIDIDIGNFFD